jgi:phage-related minor tail protein
MATTNATIDVSVNGLSNIDRLNTSLDALGRKFTGLKTALVGVAFGAFGRSALQLADELQDLSNASGIATGNLLEFKKALETSGGEAGAMSTAISNFARSIDEAAQGSLKAQQSFLELGVSLQDLANLSERDLLIKTLEGISRLPAASERAAAMMEKFGKSFRTVDPGDLANKLRTTEGSMNQYADSIKRAAELQDNLATAQGVLKLAFLEAFSGPIQRLNDFNKALEEGKAKIDGLVTVFKVLAVVIAGVFAFTGWLAVVRVIGGLGRGVGALANLFTGLGSSITKVFAPSGAAMTALRYVGGAVAAIAGGIAAVFGLSKPDSGAAPSGTQASPAEEDAKAAEKARQEEQARRQIDMSNRENAIRSVRDISAEYSKQNSLQLARMNLETELIGRSDEEKQLRQGLFDLAQKYNDVQDSLLKKKQSLTKEEQFLVPVIDEQIKKNAELYNVQVRGLEQVIGKQMVAMAAEKDRQAAIDAINKQLERQNTLSDAMVRANDRLTDVKLEGTIASLAPLQQSIARIREENRKAALEAGRNFAAQFEGMEMNLEQSKELADGLAQIADRYAAITDAQITNLEKSREFSEGWKKAFAEYADSAYNAAANAENIFKTATRGMEDAIVNFAKTGKFEWKGFLGSIVEELLRSNVRQLIAQVFGGGGGGGGGGSILGSIFGSLLGGKAIGGPVQGGTPYIVGERGPELFVPNAGGGQIVPNDKLAGMGGGTALTQVTYNINAVDASSFRSLVAQDPEFIFAVTEQGRKRMPNSRR